MSGGNGLRVIRNRWRRRGLLEFVDVSDERFLRRLDPLAVLGDVSEDAHSAEDGVAGDFGVVHAFEDAFGDAAKIAATAGQKAGELGMAIDGGAARQAVMDFDVHRVAPAKEVAFDVVAVWMIADGALAGVAGEIGLAATPEWRIRGSRGFRLSGHTPSPLRYGR